MRRHLYRKIICPAEVLEIELTDEIKTTTLRSRRYTPPPLPTLQTTVSTSSTQPANSIINSGQIYNYNNINNVINILTPTLNDTQRIMKYVEYKEKEMICLCDDIENMFSKESEKLRNDHFKYGFNLNHDDLLEVFDQTTKCKDKDFRDMNIVYNSKDDKINILDDTYEWVELLFERGGIQSIIERVQDGYLHEYERYIINKICTSNGFALQEQKERLCEYYKFISSFNVPPLCSEKNKSVFFGFVDHATLDEYYSLYKSVKEILKDKEKNSLKRDLIKILKRNLEKNVKCLYTNFFDLVSNDTDFRTYIKNACN